MTKNQGSPLLFRRRRRGDPFLSPAEGDLECVRQQLEMPPDLAEAGRQELSKALLHALLRKTQSNFDLDVVEFGTFPRYAL